MTIPDEIMQLQEENLAYREKYSKCLSEYISLINENIELREALFHLLESIEKGYTAQPKINAINIAQQALK